MTKVEYWTETRGLVPDNWTLHMVSKRALTTGLCLEGWYSEHSGVCRRSELLGKSVKVKKFWEIDGSKMRNDLKAKQRQLVFSEIMVSAESWPLSCATGTSCCASSLTKPTASRSSMFAWAASSVWAVAWQPPRTGHTASRSSWPRAGAGSWAWRPKGKWPRGVRAFVWLCPKACRLAKCCGAEVISSVRNCVDFKYRKQGIWRDVFRML